MSTKASMFGYVEGTAHQSAQGCERAPKCIIKFLRDILSSRFNQAP
jgi:hypothetical protein